jgi:hypothetical protein
MLCDSRRPGYVSDTGALRDSAYARASAIKARDAYIRDTTNAWRTCGRVDLTLRAAPIADDYSCLDVAQAARDAARDAYVLRLQDAWRTCGRVEDAGTTSSTPIGYRPENDPDYDLDPDDNADVLQAKKDELYEQRKRDLENAWRHPANTSPATAANAVEALRRRSTGESRNY